MQFDENNGIVEPQQDDEPVEIYSRRAIWWFSVPSTIVGGILLAINLYNAGYKRAMYGVLAFSAVFYLAANLAVEKLTEYYRLDLTKVNVNNMDVNTQMKFLKIGAVGIGLNIIGGTILTRYFFRKYFPEDDYYPRSITKPLLITLVVILVMNYLGSIGL